MRYFCLGLTGFLLILTRPTAGAVVENFDGWSDGSYGDYSYYTDTGVGQWVGYNSMCHSQNARSGNAVRLHHAAPAPCLEFDGLDGNGKDGGVGTVSFYYRHWNGTSGSVKFKLQKSVAGGGWTDVGGEVTVSSATYQLYSQEVHESGENVKLRVQSTAYAERLMIDDMEITDWIPMLRFAVTNTSINEAAGEIGINAVLTTPANVTAAVTIVAGTAEEGMDYSLSTTNLVFSPTVQTNQIILSVTNDLLAEDNETLTLVITNVFGAVLDTNNSRVAVTIYDDDRSSVGFESAGATVAESAGTRHVNILISMTADATVQVALAGTATSGDDYTTSSTNIVFEEGGASSNEFSLNIIDDSDGEGSETVVLTLQNAEGANVGPMSQYVLTIVDNESFINFDANQAVLEESAGSYSLPILISGSGVVTAEVTVSGTALEGAGNDFSLSTTNVFFSTDGPVQTNIIITIHNDDVAEGIERAVLTLTHVAGASLGTNQQFSLYLRDDDAFTIMSANLSSGGAFQYTDPGIRILQGLKADIVAIQEFNVTNSGGYRAFVDQNFGTNFSYYVTDGVSLPNGVISRWPILSSGTWSDPEVVRGFTWATIDIPGSRDLHIVSVHLLTADAATREREARSITNYIKQAGFPVQDFLVICGDMNTQSRGEGAIQVLTTITQDDHKPADQNGNENTNQGRDKPYDYALPNAALNLRHVPLPFGGTNFPHGLVFDSRLWTNPPPPILMSDASDYQMQHMPPLKLFSVPRDIEVLIASNIIYDLGDGNGQIEPGENAQIRVWLRNYGVQTASNVTATLSSTNALVTIVGAASSDYGNLQSDAGNYNTNLFEVAINAALPVGIYPLELSIAAQNGTWTDHVNLVVSRPLLIVTTNLPAGMEIVPYNAMLQATNGTPPYTWSIPGAYLESAQANSFTTSGTARGWHADDNYWGLNLPFDFPFFGNVYTQCWVDSNGKINFDQLGSDFSDTTNELIVARMIAVLWDDLVTDTSPEDIYVDSGPAAITIRWQAHYYSSGTPVNASLSLNADGQIRMRYGSGNAYGGLIGISGGNSSNYLISSKSQHGSMSNANDIVFESSGALPAGLTLSASGVISGTPTAAGTNHVTFIVRDSLGVTTNREIEMIVQGNPNQHPEILSNSPPQIYVFMGENTSQTFAVYAMDPEGSNLTYSWTWAGAPVGGSSGTYERVSAWGEAGNYTLRCYVSDGLWSNVVYAEWLVTILPDNDGDGLPNTYENQYVFLDPWNPADAAGNYDRDFLSNFEEYQNGTSPTNADTDGDSLLDGWEVQFGYNPLTPTGGLFGVDLVWMGRAALMINAYDVCVQSNYAYVSDQSFGLRVVDVSVPTNPMIIGQCQLPYYSMGLCCSDSYVYVAGYTNGLEVVDVTVPTNPVLVGSCDTPGYAYDAAVVGGYAYVADLNYGMQVISITNPANPRIVGSYNTSGSSYGIWVSGTNAYVADGSAGLQVLGISNPTNPIRLGQYDTPGYAIGVHVVSNTAYVGDYGSGLQIIDVSTSATPRLRGTCDTTGYVWGVVAASGYAYVADQGVGLTVLDVGVPTNPMIVGQYVGSANPNSAWVVSNNVYIADAWNGLQIIRNNGVKDFDQDGLLDSWEMYWFGDLGQAATNDPDKDGISNLGESQAGLNPLARDTDGDGISEQDEFYAGTHPANSLSFLKVGAMSNLGTGNGSKDLVILWSSVAGRYYAVSFATNLMKSWTSPPAATNLAGTGGTLSYTNQESGPSCYFRVELNKP